MYNRTTCFVFEHIVLSKYKLNFMVRLTTYQKKLINRIIVKQTKLVLKIQNRQHNNNLTHLTNNMISSLKIMSKRKIYNSSTVYGILLPSFKIQNKSSARKTALPFAIIGRFEIILPTYK